MRSRVCFFYHFFCISWDCFCFWWEHFVFVAFLVWKRFLFYARLHFLFCCCLVYWCKRNKPNEAEKRDERNLLRKSVGVCFGGKSGDGLCALAQGHGQDWSDTYWNGAREKNVRYIFFLYFLLLSFLLSLFFSPSFFLSLLHLSSFFFLILPSCPFSFFFLFYSAFILFFNFFHHTHLTTDRFNCSDSDAYVPGKKEMAKSRNKEVRELYEYGFGVHNAGMLRSDRTLTEKLFHAGAIKVGSWGRRGGEESEESRGEDGWKKRTSFWYAQC